MTAPTAQVQLFLTQFLPLRHLLHQQPSEGNFNLEKVMLGRYPKGLTGYGTNNSGVPGYGVLGPSQSQDQQNDYDSCPHLMKLFLFP